MGVPYFQVRHLEKSDGLIALSSNYALYADLSQRFMTLLGSYTPYQEIYSIDESFLDYTGFPGDLTAYSAGIKARVQQWLGLPICVGIGYSKTQAKLANHIAKKNIGKVWSGVCDLTSVNDIALSMLMARINVGEVWGVGRRIAASLNSCGIKSVLDMSRADAATIRLRFSVMLERTIRELNGISCIPMEHAPAARQQIVSSRSFGAAVTDIDGLMRAVSVFCTRAGERLRGQDLVAGRLQLFIQTSPFRKEDKQYSNAIVLPFSTPTSDTRELIMAAHVGLRRIFRPGFNYAKVGIMLFDLQAPTGVQLGLSFDERDSDKARKVMATLDALNDRFGKGTLVIGAALPTKAKQTWTMQQNKRTPEFTTNWAELPVIR
jgi:DNA polymerase V